MGKRCFDLMCAGAGLLLGLPVGVVVWIAIKFEDRGPLFFRQMRVGVNGKEFRMFKFRTMVAGADKRGLSITRSGDPRITRVGRVLRRTKLDELPQMLNVLRGEMSMVGPRPEVPRYVALYTEEQRAVLRLKPGLTDEASIAFRDEERLLARAADPERYYVTECMPAKIALNLAYSRRASVLQDFLVILRTVLTVWLRFPARTAPADEGPGTLA